jgi:chromosome segregation ATPase
VRRHVTVSEMSLQQRVKNLQEELSGWKKLFNETMQELNMCAREKAELEDKYARLEKLMYETQIEKLELKCTYLQDDNDDLRDIFRVEEEMQKRREFLKRLEEV